MLLYADRLYGLCREYKKDIWLALPTYSLAGGEHTDTFREAISQAHIILGNEEELARIYATSPEAALEKLQGAFSGEQVGFITCGVRGAALVTTERVEMIAAPPAANVVSTLGAGDTAFAGFLAGYIRKKDYRECADIAMALAAAKLSVNAARLPDPKAALAEYGIL